LSQDREMLLKRARELLEERKQLRQRIRQIEAELKVISYVTKTAISLNNNGEIRETP